MTTPSPPSPFLGALLAAWGVFGVLALLAKALLGLTPIALEALTSSELQWWHWLVTAAWIAFMAYSEGYKGFQKRFSPFVAARALELRENPSWVRGLLAPAFCMGLFQATRRRLMVSWGILIGVTLLVVVVRLLDQPWRGIVDAGVVVGLGWGAASLLASVAKGAFTGQASADPELPVAPTPS